MIALDTNVLVRYMLGDDPGQLTAATELVERRLSANDPGYTSLIVLAEFAWVLRQVYKVPRETIDARIRGLLASPVIVIENPLVVERALADGRNDFADALIHELGREAGCERTVTFDRRFARTPGVEYVGV